MVRRLMLVNEFLLERINVLQWNGQPLSTTGKEIASPVGPVSPNNSASYLFDIIIIIFFF